MRCPFCGEVNNRVIDSRLTRDSQEIRRRREETDRQGRRFPIDRFVERYHLVPEELQIILLLLYNESHGRPHAALAHAVRTAEVELETVASGVLRATNDLVPFVPGLDHERDDDGVIGIAAFDLADLTAHRTGRQAFQKNSRRTCSKSI